MLQNNETVFWMVLYFGAESVGEKMKSIAIFGRTDKEKNLISAHNAIIYTI